MRVTEVSVKGLKILREAAAQRAANSTGGMVGKALDDIKEAVREADDRLAKAERKEAEKP